MGAIVISDALTNAIHMRIRFIQTSAPEAAKSVSMHLYRRITLHAPDLRLDCALLSTETDCVAHELPWGRTFVIACTSAFRGGSTCRNFRFRQSSRQFKRSHRDAGTHR